MEQRMTQHAQQRAKARSISAFEVECLQRFGCYERVGDATRFAFDKASRRQVAAWLGPRLFNRMEAERAFDVFVVVSDGGAIITTGWRY